MARPSRSRREPSPTLEPSSWPARLALGAVRRLGWLWRLAGADVPRLEAITALYLLLGERRNIKAEKESQPVQSFSGSMVLTCFSNLVFGGMCSVALVLPDPVFGVTVCFGMITCLLVMILVSDHAPSLLDDTDLAVLLPLPVSDRTVLLARIAHIGATLLVMTLSLCLPACIVGCFRFPAFLFLPFVLLAMPLVATTAVSVAFLAFVLATRFLDPERLKNVLVWCQVGTFVLVIGGMNLLPRVLSRDDWLALPSRFSRLPYYLPSGHLGGALDLLLGNITTRNLVLSALALLVPLLLALALLRLGSRGFLTGLLASVQSARTTRPVRASHAPGGIASIRRAGWDYFAANARNDRSYKMRVYPFLVMSVVMVVVSSMRRGQIRSPEMACGGIYVLGLYLPLIQSVARCSEHWRARWIMRVAPVSDFGEFVRGATMALLVRQVVPMLVLVVIVVLLVGGIGVWPDALFATLMTATLVVSYLACATVMVPFIEKPQKPGVIAWAYVGFLVIGAFVGVHILLNTIPHAIAIANLVLLLVLGLAVRALRRRRWSAQIDSDA